jgi:hypothetical protein
MGTHGHGFAVNGDVKLIIINTGFTEKVILEKYFRIVAPHPNQ